MDNPTSLHLEVAADENDLRQHSVCLRRFLNRYALAPKSIYNAELVLEEMVGNVIRYGRAG